MNLVKCHVFLRALPLFVMTLIVGVALFYEGVFVIGGVVASLFFVHITIESLSLVFVCSVLFLAAYPLIAGRGIVRHLFVAVCVVLIYEIELKAISYFIAGYAFNYVLSLLSVIFVAGYMWMCDIPKKIIVLCNVSSIVFSFIASFHFVMLSKLLDQ